MRRMYLISRLTFACPNGHGGRTFEGQAWEGNLLIDVGSAVKRADTHATGVLSCGCQVAIDWYASDERPQVHAA